jgi:hypothetical protein
VKGVKGTVETNSTIRTPGRKIYALLAATILLTALGSLNVRQAQAGSQNQAQPQPASSEPLVIQGRITEIAGAIVTVKTPDGFPGGPGMHAQFVIAGPTFKVDVSRARVLLPDGRQEDRQPLAVGDRVLMILNQPDSGSTAPANSRNAAQTYSASIVERIVQGDRVVTH